MQITNVTTTTRNLLTGNKTILDVSFLAFVLFGIHYNSNGQCVTFSRSTTIKHTTVTHHDSSREFHLEHAGNDQQRDCVSRRGNWSNNYHRRPCATQGAS